MLDIRFIRENAELVQASSQRKGYKIHIQDLLDADNERRELQSKADELRTRRNEVSGQMKGGKPSDDLVEEGRRIKTELAELEDHLRVVDERYTALLKAVPNMPSDDVPVGASEDENVEVKVVGDKPSFDFEPKNHYEIAGTKGWLDKDRAAKVAGARFAYIMGDLVMLQQAVIQFVMTTLSNEEKIKEIAKAAALEGIDTRPFIPVLPPLMIRTEPYDQMDRLEPRDDRYKIEGEELWLQGSAEHVLGSMHAGEIFESNQLPRRYLGFATSFRKEAGTYGKDMEGLIRMHQFDKLEMESFTESKDGYNEHLLFVAIQEYLLQQLGIPYHVLMKCTADNMTDYQARRLQTRVRTGDGIALIHTNDATAFALGRCMVAIIENYQTREGDVRIPDVLRPFMGNRERI